MKNRLRNKPIEPKTLWQTHFTLAPIIKRVEMGLNKSQSWVALVSTIVILLILGLSTTSFAAALEFAHLKSANKVTFVFVPAGNLAEWPDFKKWDDVPVRHFGCFYSTADTIKINTLVEIMKRGGFESSGEKPTNGPAKTFGDVREALYFSYADGTEFRLLLKGYFWLNSPETKNTRAQVHRSDSASDYYQFFYANDTLPWHLMHWASYLGKPELGESSPEYDSKRKCENAINYFIQGVVPNQSDSSLRSR